MELNKTSKGTERNVRNPEGSLVKNRSPEIQLYLEGSNLNIKSNDFYQSAETKLNSFVELAKKTDEAYLLGLAKFLADNGIKLSPVVLTSVLSAEKKYSFKNANVGYIFNTPQRISEAISLNNSGLKLNNSFKENVLKKSLENMKDFSLKKNQLKSRKVKTKDLIKLLRPKPQTEERSQLYKDIIEEKAKLPESATFTRVKSSKKYTDEEKVEYLKNNINKIPLNELIRNLRFIVDNTDFSNDRKLQEQVMKRLKSINDFRFLNIFDLIETAIAVPELEKMLFEVIKNFANKVREEFDFDKEATFLFDVSGSMMGGGLDRGFKYLVLLSLLFEKPTIRYFCHYLTEDKSNEVVELIKKGKLGKAREQIYTMGGTALIGSVRNLLKEKPEIKNLFIISDEVSWVEGTDLRGEIDEMSKLIGDRKVTLINPVVYKGSVFKGNVMAFASLSSSIVYNVALHISPQKFVNYIREYGKG